MTKAQADQLKSAQARKARRAQYDAQTIVIDPNWRILRTDCYNWEIQYKGRFYGFYGRLLNAFQALPAKMLDEEVRGPLEAIKAQQEAINSRIATALKLKLA